MGVTLTFDSLSSVVVVQTYEYDKGWKKPRFYFFRFLDFFRSFRFLGFHVQRPDTKL